jgi:hypothetical protein
MPWKIVAGGKGCPFEVVSADTGKHVACHPTRAKAEAHLRAPYANEPSAAGKAHTMDAVMQSVKAGTNRKGGTTSKQQMATRRSPPSVS